MGVRGASSREHKRPKSDKLDMKSFSLVEEEQPVSNSTPPTSPTPPPSLVPEPHIGTGPRVRHDLPPPHSVDSHRSQTQHPPNPRNLLITPVKSNRARGSDLTLRPPSSRIAQNAQKLQGQEQDTAEEAFIVEFRVYPFPPSRRPLCYPLPEKAHSSESFTESDSTSTTRKPALRKMLLQRWREEHVLAQRDNTGSTMQETMSDASQRQLNDSPRITRKRSRSPTSSDVSDDETPVLRTMSGVAHSVGPAPFHLDEGDPVLPMIGSSRAVEVRTQKAGSTIPSGDTGLLDSGRSSERSSKYSRIGSQSTMRRNAAGSHTMGGGDSPNLTTLSLKDTNRDQRLCKSRQEMPLIRAKRKSSKERAVKAQSCEVYTRPTEGVLQALKSKVYALKDRRQYLEQKELDDVVTEAATSAAVTVSDEDRIMLKEEIEHLQPRAVRNVLRLISRRMRGLEVSPHVEVKLQLDILPLDLTKELKILVLREKGQFALPTTLELEKVRTELRHVVREYRRQSDLLSA